MRALMFPLFVNMELRGNHFVQFITDNLGPLIGPMGVIIEEDVFFSMFNQWLQALLGQQEMRIVAKKLLDVLGDC